MLLRCPLFLPLFRVFSCWFLVFFSYVLFSGFWFLIWVQLPFFFFFSVQFPQFFFFVCVSAQSSPFKTKTNGGKSTRICCWLSDQKFPWVLSLFVLSTGFFSSGNFSLRVLLSTGFFPSGNFSLLVPFCDSSIL